MVNDFVPGKVTYSSKNKSVRDIHRGFMFKEDGVWKNPTGTRTVSDETANHYNAQRRHALSVADSWKVFKAERGDVAKRVTWNIFQRILGKVEKTVGKGEKARVVRSSDPVLLIRNLERSLARRGVPADERARLAQTILERTTIEDYYSSGRRKFNIYGVGY